MAKALTPRRAPGDPLAEPGLVQKPPRKKSRKRSFRKSKGREAGRTPGGGPRAVVARPPKAPEDFSRNWRALRETEPKKQPRIVAQKRRAIPDAAQRREMETETAHAEAVAAPVPSDSPRNRKMPAPRTQASGAEHGQKGARKRTDGNISPEGGDLRHKKRKAKEVTLALPPALPTEEDIWFDDVDPADIEAALGPEAARIARKQLGQSASGITLVKEPAFGGLTRALAMDCEMVGVGPKGEESIAARVSVVNQYGKCVYDKYVKPTQPVTDYRTAVSGIRPESLKQGESLEVIQQEVADLLKGRILVGHALHHDLKVLFLDHPKKKIRDTQKYKPFKSQVKSGRPSLKLLAEKLLGIRVQEAEHCSIQDAQTAMRLYILVKKEWESTAQDRRPTAPAPDGGSVSVPKRS
ncbi:RNA exonuclease 4 isoform X2 [Lontra canadensis]|uniref:RNA exonuclease 4 isoform X2 n=1 Tax=Lontra canadensis TaxID=76717 RepID=UPI0013F3554C|nr:RNA exonuclease 4 isoform X2 [Lontra canadensis]